MMPAQREHRRAGEHVLFMAGIRSELSKKRGDALSDFAGLTFAPVVTPLPGAPPLFATGLGALGLLGWRRKKKAIAA